LLHNICCWCRCMVVMYQVCVSPPTCAETSDVIVALTTCLGPFVWLWPVFAGYDG
jgi:hypothetical protein